MTDTIMQNVGDKVVPMLVAEDAPLHCLADALRMSTTTAIVLLNRALDVLSEADTKDDSELSDYMASELYQTRVEAKRATLDSSVTLRSIAASLAIPVDFVGTALVRVVACVNRETTGENLQ
jgi:hypothetical protein